MTLRRFAAGLSIAFFILTFGTAAGLIAFTSSLEKTASEIATNVESIRIASEIKTRLMEYSYHTLMSHMKDDSSPELRRQQEEELLRLVNELESFVSSAAEAEQLNVKSQAIRDYFVQNHNMEHAGLSDVQLATQSRADFEKVSASINRFIAINSEQARALKAEARNMDSIANIFGTLVAILCLGVLPLLWFAIRVWFYVPIQKLIGGILCFSGTDKNAVVQPDGTAEIRAVAAAFNDLNHRLADQRKNQLRFLASVAHDLRNPLGAIKMSTEILAEEGLTDQQRNVVEIVQRQSLSQLIKDAIELHRPLSPIHRLESSTPSQEVYVECDPARMNQVLNNLLSNAIKYSPNGGRILVGLSRFVGPRRPRKPSQGSDWGCPPPKKSLKLTAERLKWKASLALERPSRFPYLSQLRGGSSLSQMTERLESPNR